jgi:prophage regulatory protein
MTIATHQEFLVNLNVTMAAQAPRSSRVLRIAQVMNKSGLSKASIYRLGKLGRFPLPFRIGISAVGWDEAEIEFWIFERKLDTIH